MSEAQVRRLPVIDEQERLCGIVSLGDLSRETRQRLRRSKRWKASASPAASTSSNGLARRRFP